ncbi:MAG: deoxyhypusine synthase family protein [Pirellulaceae bacterium]|jgi:deoxyhypusine synthase|nr:deoxyhypusine synthase family protein [Pirellulaceae bacterium]MDP6554057.1 deoxyhypusine synthase family protein [Pirellulaceae bacterium]MDP6719221.1 deoxyhypusine synthase family protein [Pirellulaceae bacterium]
MSVSAFLEKHFRHFNARETLAAAQAYKKHTAEGGKILLAMAGAMSTAELGISLAQMIRAGQVHAISCTAANLEEDIFNLVAHDEYKIVSNYRDLSPQGELALRDDGFNRVTDTCIPETAMRHLERYLLEYWVEAGEAGVSRDANEYFFRLFDENKLEPYYQIPPEESWVLAAHEMRIPVFTPGFEDSTLGNIFAARVIDGTVKSHSVIKNGTAQMETLVRWYLDESPNAPIGFFQIGGGIAGDFAICAVPLIIQDLRKDVPLWSYFAQISDSTTSYGSYSGAVPNEKITWFKLAETGPKFMINSDASIVAPLIFAYVLGQ